MIKLTISNLGLQHNVFLPSMYLHHDVYDTDRMILIVDDLNATQMVLMMMMLPKFSPSPSSTNDLVLMLIMMLMMLMILIIQLIMMNITMT